MFQALSTCFQGLFLLRPRALHGPKNLSISANSTWTVASKHCLPPGGIFSPLEGSKTSVKRFFLVETITQIQKLYKEKKTSFLNSSFWKWCSINHPLAWLNCSSWISSSVTPSGLKIRRVSSVALRWWMASVAASSMSWLTMGPSIDMPRS